MKLSGASITRIQEALARREDQVPIVGLHRATEDFAETMLEIIAAEEDRECERNVRQSWQRLEGSVS